MTKTLKCHRLVVSLCCYMVACTSCGEKLDFSSQIIGEIPSPTPSSLIYLSLEGRYGWHIVLRQENNQDQPLSLGRFDTKHDWSWDKQYIVYVRGALGSPNLQVWKMRYNGNDKTPITPIKIDCQSPRFSPDGQKIVFAALTDTINFSRHIVMTNSDGTMWQQITNASIFPGAHSVHYDFPSWAPDGKHIVVSVSIRYQNSTTSTILGIIDLTTGIVQEITNVRYLSPWLPEWSPLGDKIAFVSDIGGNDIWTVNIDGSDLQQLTNDNSSWEPDWSSDGKQIVYSKREGDLQSFLHVIYIMNSDGSNKRVLFQPKFLVGNPRI